MDSRRKTFRKTFSERMRANRENIRIYRKWKEEET